MKTHRSGYILLFTLMIISAITVMVTGIVGRVVTQRRLARLFADRERAYQLALGGIEIAKSQLTVEPKEEKETPQAKKEPHDETAEFVERLLRYLNHWQTFKLNEERDGIEGEVQLYITSEQGKIDLNALYDFKAKKFIVDGALDARKLIQLFADKFKPISGDVNIVDMLERFMQSREYPIEDISELLSIKGFGKFNDFLWSAPPPQDKKEPIIALTDVFTVNTYARSLQPVVISPSLQFILGFKQQAYDEKGSKQKKETAKLIKTAMNWQQEWDKVLAPLYGKGYTDVPAEIRSLYISQFEATMFSVISYATIGAVTVKLCAIIEKLSQKEKTPTFVLRKLYWL